MGFCDLCAQRVSPVFVFFPGIVFTHRLIASACFYFYFLLARKIDEQRPPQFDKAHRSFDLLAHIEPSQSLGLSFETDPRQEHTHGIFDAAPSGLKI